MEKFRRISHISRMDAISAGDKQSESRISGINFRPEIQIDFDDMQYCYSL